jgi:hypothetical protein
LLRIGLCACPNEVLGGALIVVYRPTKKGKDALYTDRPALFLSVVPGILLASGSRELPCALNLRTLSTALRAATRASSTLYVSAGRVGEVGSGLRAADLDRAPAELRVEASGVHICLEDGEVA